MAFQGTCGLGNNMCKQTKAPPPPAFSSYAAFTENPTDSTLGEEELYILF
jgi:hypothetical protein